MADTQPVRVELGLPLQRAALRVAWQQHVTNYGRSCWKGGPPNSLLQRMVGTLAEVAVASYLGLLESWNPADTPEMNRTYGDIAWAMAPIQVRAPLHGADRGMLLLDKRDDPLHLHVLARMDKHLTFCNVVGWEVGRNLIKDEFWGCPAGFDRPCYAVPDTRLRPMPELLQLVQGVVPMFPLEQPAEGAQP